VKARILALGAAFVLACPALASGQAPPAPVQEPRRPVVVKVSEGGFHWGDAAIGAAAASGAAIVLAGVAMVRRQP
jgi:hypothetical protein